MKTEQILDDIFQAEKLLREKEIALFNQAPEEVKQILSSRLKQLMSDESDEAVMCLERLSDLIAQLDDEASFLLLIQILNHTEPSVRVHAGEALVDLAYEKYAPFAHAIEDWCDQHTDGPALQELPWLVAEIGEPSSLKLIRRFLASESAEVVSSAIEALVSLGDENAMQDLKKLIHDKRNVSLDDFEDETMISIGELAQQAINELESIS